MIAVARARRDAGDEVVLLGGGLGVDQLGRAAVAEDAVEVVLVGDEADVERVRSWLDDHAATGVDVSRAGE